MKSYVTRQCGRVLNGRASIGEYTFAREYRGRSSYRPGACVPALELTRYSKASLIYTGPENWPHNELMRS